jgi:hypothetical protein
MKGIMYSKRTWEESGLPSFVAFPCEIINGEFVFECINIDESLDDGIYEVVFKRDNMRDGEFQIKWEQIEPGIYPGSLEIVTEENNVNFENQ